MRILLTGGTGQVGTEFKKAAPKNWQVTAPDRDTLNLGSASSIEAAFGDTKWDLIVNAGAYTAVDKAENDVANAWQINGVAPALIANLAAKTSTPLIHISTDYVFDGTKASAYGEDDPIRPLGVYGASKAAGELEVRAAGGNSVCLRTAWVVSSHGNNFVKTMLRLGAERSVLRVVADQHGCPTGARDIAKALTKMAPQMLTRHSSPGTYHFVCDGEGSWWDLAAVVFAEAERRGRKAPAVEAIVTAEYPTPAKRPANSRLTTDRIRKDFGVEPRAWKLAVSEIVAELISDGQAGTS